MSSITILVMFFGMLSIGVNAQSSKRLLLIFGTPQQQLEQLHLFRSDSVEVQERDLEIVLVEKKSEYESHRVNPTEFAVLLIGKDGGEKYRSSKPVQPKAIFDLIDSMPMRQAEMRRKKSK